MNINSIKALAALIVSGFVTTFKSLSDGFQPKDLYDIFGKISLEVLTKFEALKNVKEEFKEGLTPEEVAELQRFIKEEFVKADLGVAKETELDAMVAAYSDAVVANINAGLKTKAYIAARKAG